MMPERVFYATKDVLLNTFCASLYNISKRCEQHAEYKPLSALIFQAYILCQNAALKLESDKHNNTYRSLGMAAYACGFAEAALDALRINRITQHECGQQHRPPDIDIDNIIAQANIVSLCAADFNLVFRELTAMMNGANDIDGKISTYCLKKLAWIHAELKDACDKNWDSAHFERHDNDYNNNDISQISETLEALTSFPAQH